MRPVILSAALLSAAMFASATLAESARPPSSWAKTFIAGDTSELWSAMTADLRAAAGSEAAFAALQRQVAEGFGEEVAIVSETERVRGEVTSYTRISEWSKTDRRLSIQVTVDQRDRVSGFRVQPVAQAAESQYQSYQTKADLQLPFTDSWTVYWGGRSIEDNYHAVDSAQRFASDFVVTRNGRTHEGDSNEPESYHCWNRPILAPADGEVVAAVNGLKDQSIGERDPGHPAGNHVVIDFGNGEFGFLAHLRKDSVAVSVGDRVTAGQEVGRCGNSGNTSEPHLHFHLQTTPDLNNGEGLPAQFVSYVADGEPVPRGEPRKGQIISPDTE